MAIFATMELRSLLPNLVTACNALCGMLGILSVFQNRFEWALLFFLLGIFCDFLDGALARLLQVTSPLGLQLDSLADLITSGVLPGVMVYQLLRSQSDAYWELLEPPFIEGGALTLSKAGVVGVFLTLGTAFRLAHFNVSKEQINYFKGLASPASALFFMGYPLLLSNPLLAPLYSLLSQTNILIFWTLFFVFLMNSPLRMFKIKYKSTYDQIYMGILGLGSLVLFYFFGWASFSLCVVWYLLLCLVRNVPL